jgi:hypothetical protein
VRVAAIAISVSLCALLLQRCLAADRGLEETTRAFSSSRPALVSCQAVLAGQINSALYDGLIARRADVDLRDSLGASYTDTGACATGRVVDASISFTGGVFDAVYTALPPIEAGPQAAVVTDRCMFGLAWRRGQPGTVPLVELHAPGIQGGDFSGFHATKVAFDASPEGRVDLDMTVQCDALAGTAPHKQHLQVTFADVQALLGGPSAAPAFSVLVLPESLLPSAGAGFPGAAAPAL